MSFEATETELETLFSDVGPVLNVFLPLDRATGRPRGFAFVEFDDDDHAEEAINKFDGHDLGGRPLRLNRAEDRPQRERPKFSDGNSRGGGPPRPSRPKGSRKGRRGKKRSL